MNGNSIEARLNNHKATLEELLDKVAELMTWRLDIDERLFGKTVETGGDPGVEAKQEPDRGL